MVVSPSEVKHSLFISFEGCSSEDDFEIVFAGAYRPYEIGSKRYQINFFDSMYIKAATHIHYPSNIQSFREFISNCIEEVLSKQSKIFLWSSYELKVIEQYAPDLIESFRSVAIDFHDMASTSTVGNQSFSPSNQLESLVLSYANCQNLSRSLVENFRAGSIGPITFNDISKFNQKDWDHWSQDEKDQFRNLVEYNFQDCRWFPALVSYFSFMGI